MRQLPTSAALTPEQEITAPITPLSFAERQEVVAWTAQQKRWWPRDIERQLHLRILDRYEMTCACFTQEDVNDFWDAFSAWQDRAYLHDPDEQRRRDRLHSLGDRIAALLPPPSPATSERD